MYRIPKKYHRIYRGLTQFDLQKSALSENFLTQNEILSDLTEKTRSHLFLNYYSEKGIYTAFEAYGIFRILKFLIAACCARHSLHFIPIQPNITIISKAKINVFALIGKTSQFPQLKSIPRISFLL